MIDRDWLLKYKITNTDKVLPDNSPIETLAAIEILVTRYAHDLIGTDVDDQTLNTWFALNSKIVDSPELRSKIRHQVSSLYLDPAFRENVFKPMFNSAHEED